MPNIARQPCYRDRWTNYPVQSFDPGDCTGEPVEFEPDDGLTTFTVRLRQSEFTAILSALMFGANILYQDSSQQVLWYWLRNSECAMELCLEVLQSFAENPECQLGLTALLQQLGVDTGSGGTYSKIATGTYDEKRTALFSGALALVEFCSEAIADLYDIFEAAIETSKGLVMWMEMVPGLDLSPAYEIAEAADAIIELGQSLFEGTDTQTWREQEACRIMCLCVANDYGISTGVLDKWRDSLNERFLTPPAAFYYEFTMGCPDRALIDRFVLGTNDGNEDWQLLCDPCAETCGTLTFDAPESDLPYEIVHGTIGDNGNPGDCIRAIEYPDGGYSHGRRLELIITLPADWMVDNLAYDIYWANASMPEGEIRREVTLYSEAMAQLGYWHELGTLPQYEWVADSLSGDEPVAGVRYLKFAARFFCTCPDQRAIRMDNMQVRGIGCGDG